MEPCLSLCETLKQINIYFKAIHRFFLNKLKVDMEPCLSLCETLKQINIYFKAMYRFFLNK
jgi:hypothetical protein